MLKVEIHRRCTVVSLRNNLECRPDVASARQNGPKLQGGHNREQKRWLAFHAPSVWFICTTSIQQRSLTGCQQQMLQSVHSLARMKKGFCARKGSDSKHVIDFLQFRTVIRLRASSRNICQQFCLFHSGCKGKHTLTSRWVTTWLCTSPCILTDVVVKPGVLWPALEQFGVGSCTMEGKPHPSVCGRATPSLPTINHECRVDADHSSLTHICRAGPRERLFWGILDSGEVTLYPEKALYSEEALALQNPGTPAPLNLSSWRPLTSLSPWSQDLNLEETR